MTTSRYPYEPDEFDAPAPAGAPVGVHRAPRSSWSRVWPFLVVVVLAGGLGIGAVAYVSMDDDAAPVASSETSGDGADDGATADESPSDEATEEPTDEQTEEPTDESTDEATEEPTDEPTEDADALLAAADLSTYVRVLNEGGPAGEAAAGQAALTTAGFSDVAAGNYPEPGSGVAANTIWYVEGRQETALAVAATLGIPAEQISQVDLRDGEVIVVITEDLPNAG